MSIIIKINSEPNISYRHKAERYYILNEKNEVICKMNYAPYELKEEEKIFCLFSQSLNLEEYLEEIEYESKSFFQEITDNIVALSEKEKNIFEEIKSEMLISFITHYFEELEEINVDEFKIIEIKLRRVHLKFSDLEEIKENLYKLKSAIVISLTADLNLKNSQLLQNLEFKKEEIEDLYSEYEQWFPCDENQNYFGMGFIYTYDQIKNNVQPKDDEKCIHTDEVAYRYVDQKLIKIKNYSWCAFMNLADCLTVKLNDENIYNIHGSCECA